MQKHERLVVQTIQGLLDQAQLSHRIEQGKNHLAVVVTSPDGGEHKLPIAGSPRSDEKSLMNMARQQTNRLLREFGLDPDGTRVKKAS